MYRAMQAALPSVVALAAALLSCAVLIALSGQSPGLAFAALLQGAFGSLDGLSEVCVKACPLLLTGLAISVSFRTGLWNIGAEGQLIMGALAVVAIAPLTASLPAVLGIIVGLTAAGLAGGAWAAIAGVLKLRRNVSEVISTIMLNFVALYLLSYLVQGPLMEAGGRYPQSDALPASLWLPRLFPPHRLHAGTVLAVVIALAVHVLLTRTRAGYEMRATGANLAAARLAGIPVERRFLMAVMFSGALAGLAGGVEVSAITHRVYEKLSPGWGFTAIAVGLLGRLSAPGVILSAFLFGALDAGSSAMQRVAGVSSVLASVIQATVILFLIAFERFQLPRASPATPNAT